MKYYTSNSPEAVNSQQRNPDDVIIPPFDFKGSLVASASNSWSPPYDCIITGGRAITRSIGSTNLMLVVYKNNAFEEDLVVAEAVMPALGGVVEFALENAMTGNLTISTYDNIAAAALNASGHMGVNIQLFAKRINV